MPEQFPANRQEHNRDQKKEFIALAKELMANQEVFVFPGINPAFYTKMKVEELEYPGFATPIDELLERFKNEGAKVVFGEYPESGNVFVLPFLSDDIENDGILISRLQEGDAVDARLNKLILIKKG